jgi:glycosyltransferase involved in cell wall biosynthesis
MKFSVLLSVYKDENPAYLNKAFLSIWDEQSLKPNQIVLVKDGPLIKKLDDTIVEWRKKLGDVLTLVELPKNIGLGAALNEGLKYCQYDLVARMDTNDVSLSDRFEKQVAFMDSHSNIAASSGTLEEWDESLEHCITVRILPGEPDELVRFAQYRSPLSHPVTIYRKSIILLIGGYPPFRRSQDYALWSLLLKRGYELANIKDTLYRQRAGNDFMKRRRKDFKDELSIYRYQRKIGFITNRIFFRNIIIRGILCFSPDFIRKLLYQYAR